MRSFFFFCLLAAIPASALADSICRQPHQAELGVAINQGGNGFVITESCEEPRLKIQRPAPLSIRFRPQQSPTPTPPARITASNPVDHLRGESADWTVWFDLDKAELTDSAKAVLDTVHSTAKVRVTGYTCRLGSEKHNRDLSRHRAESVGAYLQKRGITVVSEHGQGECCPISTHNLARNRRVVIQQVKETDK